MSGTLGEAVSAAAMRTMRGCAQVRLKVQTRVPDFDARSEYSGVVDFDSERCRLEGTAHVEGETAPASIILDGETTYMRESDARWVVTRGAEGTRGMLHPSGLLGALVRAQMSVTQIDDRMAELRLDHDVLNAAADAGLAPDWQSSAVAEISRSGRIANVVLTHRSAEDPDALIRLECEISEPIHAGVIDLPPPDATIARSALVDQEQGRSEL